jgi:thymidine phosphorylase
MDIKVGSGAFMKDIEHARKLARSIIQVGRQAGLKVRALLTRMDAPLGHAVGNALETREAIDFLKGKCPADLHECTFALCATLLREAKLAKNDREARAQLARVLADGSALQKLRQVIKAQGGDAAVVDDHARLPRARVVIPVHAPRSGYVHELDALEVGLLAQQLGAGRTRTEDSIDPAVGIWLHKKPGDRVKKGEPLADIHARTRASGQRAAAALSSIYKLRKAAPKLPSVIIERH